MTMTPPYKNVTILNCESEKCHTVCKNFGENNIPIELIKGGKVDTLPFFFAQSRQHRDIVQIV